MEKIFSSNIRAYHTYFKANIDGSLWILGNMKNLLHFEENIYPFRYTWNSVYHFLSIHFNFHNDHNESAIHNKF